MSDRWGQQYRIHIFGESHGPGIGVVIDGMEPGIRWDEDYIHAQLKRRRPGGALASARNEEDVLSQGVSLRGIIEAMSHPRKRTTTARTTFRFWELLDKGIML